MAEGTWQGGGWRGPICPFCTWELSVFGDKPAWVVLDQRGCPGPSSPNIFHFASEKTEGRGIAACLRPLALRNAAAPQLKASSASQALILEAWWAWGGDHLGRGLTRIEDGAGEASNEQWLALCTSCPSIASAPHSDPKEGLAGANAIPIL